jgi:hypothetical protein
MLFLLFQFINSQNVVPPVGLGEVCGGLLDVQCKDGLVCQVRNSTIGVVNDEQGICAGVMTILPVPHSTVSATVPSATVPSATVPSASSTSTATTSTQTQATPTASQTSGAMKESISLFLIYFLTC